ncbi:MAG: hypothetical protein U1E38_00625 [Rhodospirillales bacterium]
MSGSAVRGSARPARDHPLLAPMPWLFDLDNTLYPAAVDLFAQIDERMRAYIANFLDLDLDAAYALQKQYFYEYGTSMRGLMDRRGLDPRRSLRMCTTSTWACSIGAAAGEGAGGAALTARSSSPMPRSRMPPRPRPARRRSPLRRNLRHRRRRVPAEAGGDLPRADRTARDRPAADGDGRGHGPQSAAGGSSGMTTVWVRTGSEWERSTPKPATSTTSSTTSSLADRGGRRADLKRAQPRHPALALARSRSLTLARLPLTLAACGEGGTHREAVGG